MIFIVDGTMTNLLKTGRNSNCTQNAKTMRTQHIIIVLSYYLCNVFGLLCGLCLPKKSKFTSQNNTTREMVHIHYYIILPAHRVSQSFIFTLYVFC